MKTENFLSEAAFLERRRELKSMSENFRPVLFPLTKENMMTEEDVGALLGVTTRTVRKYRKEHYINGVKIYGRIFYLKHLLYFDLEDLYYKAKGNN